MERLRLVHILCFSSCLFYQAACQPTPQVSQTSPSSLSTPLSLANLSSLEHWLNLKPLQPSQRKLNSEQLSIYNELHYLCQQENLNDWFKEQLIWLGPLSHDRHSVAAHKPKQVPSQMPWPLPLASSMIDLSNQQLNSSCALASVMLALANYQGPIYLDLSNNEIDDTIVSALITLLRRDQQSTSRPIQVNLLQNTLSDNALSTLIHYQKENPQRLFDIRNVDLTTFVDSTIRSMKDSTPLTVEKSVSSLT